MTAPDHAIKPLENILRERGHPYMETFEHGRDLAAWLGLVPRQSTTGGKPRLFGIGKRGNKYPRKLLIHGARAAFPHIAERDTAPGRWAKGLLARAHQNHKNARGWGGPCVFEGIARTEKRLGPREAHGQASPLGSANGD